MARRKTRATQRAQKRIKHDDDLVQDTAGRFTCALETSRDLADACERRTEELELDLLFYALARDIWRGREPRTEPLAAILSDFVAEAERHRRAIEDLTQRLAPIASDDEFHVHLDPPEAFRDLVRQRILVDPPPHPRLDSK